MRRTVAWLVVSLAVPGASFGADSLARRADAVVGGPGTGHAILEMNLGAIRGQTARMPKTARRAVDRAIADAARGLSSPSHDPFNAQHHAKRSDGVVEVGLVNLDAGDARGSRTWFRTSNSVRRNGRTDQVRRTVELDRGSAPRRIEVRTSKTRTTPLGTSGRSTTYTARRLPFGVTLETLRVESSEADPIQPVRVRTSRHVTVGGLRLRLP